MSNLIYSFAIGDAAFISENLKTRTIVALDQLTLEQGFFYDLMGDGFVFGESPQAGLVALIVDPTLVCSDPPPPTEPVAEMPRLSAANAGRSPKCKMLLADANNILIRFETDADDVLTYRPDGANWRLSLTHSGLVTGIEIIDYLERFWDDRASRVFDTRPAARDYAVFADYFGLLSDLESAELFADEIAVDLAEFRRSELADTSGSDRLSTLATAIDAYADDWISSPS